MRSFFEKFIASFKRVAADEVLMRWQARLK